MFGITEIVEVAEEKPLILITTHVVKYVCLEGEIVASTIGTGE